MGYAEKLGYDSTGFNPRVNANGWSTSTSSSALNNLKAGDIVRYKNNGHSIFVTAVNGDTVTYTDCNSDGHCIIRWDQKISKATLRASFTHVRIAPRTLVTNEGHNPQGMVDSAGGGFSKVGAAGWAFDADNYGAALEIHIYMDGKLLGTTVANLYRPDVNNVYKCGDYHGYAFETEVDASMSGEHAGCICNQCWRWCTVCSSGIKESYDQSGQRSTGYFRHSGYGYNSKQLCGFV